MLADIAAQFRAHPVATLLELASVVVCIGLFLGTLLLLSSGAPTGRGGPWLALIGVGAVFVVFWTALVPIYERLVYA
ncbi:hypothetical protein [Natronolimnohabitans innermongolicus]|uniref:Uncharacterized protein n=1 Tax=Natronolimnohabitans innermongolicus JCM 12255 TaxID=1227499 RepID=L9WZL0_9EURY|nr:hypothetical protein [Natronolimnohabitans innermongolicus]ELY54900.1 hypothetical protein C493_12012 [Natronolimnohabitans innermongolicus JCM 12255]